MHRGDREGAWPDRGGERCGRRPLVASRCWMNVPRLPRRWIRKVGLCRAATLSRVGVLLAVCAGAYQFSRTPNIANEDHVTLHAHHYLGAPPGDFDADGYATADPPPPWIWEDHTPEASPVHRWTPPSYGTVLRGGAAGDAWTAPPAASDEAGEACSAAAGGVVDFGSIPRIIHYTHRAYDDLHEDLKGYIDGCMRLNPGWEVRFYDDRDARDFVGGEFPGLVGAWDALDSPVQRADMFRYLVLLRYGGAYLDVDIECRLPFETVIDTERDALVAGIENAFETPEQASTRTYARTVQVVQWSILAAPGHPALRLAASHIARTATFRIAQDDDRNTLERTGPGAWSDALARYMSRSASLAPGCAWPVRLLPRVAMGNFPSGLDGLPAHSPGEVLVHHFEGSWKRRGVRRLAPRITPGCHLEAALGPVGRWAAKRLRSGEDLLRYNVLLRALLRLLFFRTPRPAPRPPAVPLSTLNYTGDLLERDRDGVVWTVLRSGAQWRDAQTAVAVALPGVDEAARYDRDDPSREVLRWGAWEPGAWVARGPMGHEALMSAAGVCLRGPAYRAARPQCADGTEGSPWGTLGLRVPDTRPRRRWRAQQPLRPLEPVAEAPCVRDGDGAARGAPVFVDVGVGLGAASLHAAASGMRVIAFESDPRLLERSVAANAAFQDRVTLHPRAVAAGRGRACLYRGRTLEPQLLAAPPGTPRGSDAADDAALAQLLPLALEQTLAAPAPVKPALRARGAPPGLYGMAPGSDECSATAAGPGRVVETTSLDEALFGADCDNDDNATAALCGSPWVLRIAQPGWERAVLRGAGRALQGANPPVAVLLEVSPAQEAWKGVNGAGWSSGGAVQELHAIGFEEAFVSGPACDDAGARVPLGRKIGLAKGQRRGQVAWCAVDAVRGRARSALPLPLRADEERSHQVLLLRRDSVGAPRRGTAS
ncbi:unnamed protein product [Pedinophyceae sp. YPF-701]|nr:unnamed protein product [Pedinophyceae sp. YPF-701]